MFRGSSKTLRGGENVGRLSDNVLKLGKYVSKLGYFIGRLGIIVSDWKTFRTEKHGGVEEDYFEIRRKHPEVQ